MNSRRYSITCTGEQRRWYRDAKLLGSLEMIISSNLVGKHHRQIARCRLIDHLMDLLESGYHIRRWHDVALQTAQVRRVIFPRSRGCIGPRDHGRSTH